ncbi:hypothetical protein BFS06_13835 [Clostridium perfringens]|uniref:hypothetical protein n=1 Tax=Clostridium perfringens TaxID=1502 RepID=UPI00103E06D5|nr:hypothetical protein [Clostridium perfringens]TBX14286.1 hypothetical protein BFS06_13835 [Clostridium perfringens]
MYSEAERKSLEAFVTNLEWKVCNASLKSINGFNVYSFKFDFELDKYEEMIEFIYMLKGVLKCKDKVLYPTDIINFLLTKDKKFVFKYRYNRELKFKANIFCYKVYRGIKKDLKILNKL